MDIWVDYRGVHCSAVGLGVHSMEHTVPMRKHGFQKPPSPPPPPPKWRRADLGITP